MRIYSLFSIALITVIVMSCYGNKASDIKFQLKITDELDRPIAEAIVSVGEKKLGMSNADGMFNGVVQIPSDQKKLALKIAKPTDQQFYFADSYVELRRPIPENNTPQQTIAVQLVSVPKQRTQTDEHQTFSSLHPDETLGPPKVENVVAQNEESDSELENIETQSTASIASTPPTQTTDEVLTVIVHVHQKGRPLVLAKVWTDQDSDKIPAIRCITNERGRCTIKVNSHSIHTPPREVTFLAQKDGFISELHKLTIKEPLTEIDFDLNHGQSVEVFVFESIYSRHIPISGAKVTIRGGESVFSDASGFASLPFTSPPTSTPVQIEFAAAGMFNISKSIGQVERAAGVLPVMLTRSNPRIANVALANVVPTVNEIEGLAKSAEEYSSQVQLIAKKTLMTQSVILNYVEASGEKTDYKILLEIGLGNNVRATASLINEQGRIVAGQSRNIDLKQFNKNPDNDIRQLILDICKSIPLEVSALGINDGQISFNIGKGRLPWLTELAVVSFGRSDSRSTAKTCVIGEVWNELFTCKANSPVDAINIGDRFSIFEDPSYRAKNTAVKLKKFEIQTVDENKTAISGVQVFINSEWVGESDQTGKLSVEAQAPGMSSIFARKAGHLDSSLPIASTSSDAVEQLIVLHKRVRQIHLTSQPNHAAVFVNGVAKGKTPLSIDINNLKEATIEVAGSKAYKSFKKSISLDKINAASDNSEIHVVLETDFRDLSKSLVASGKFQEAIELLQKVSPEQNDYLFAQHDIGEIYLRQLNDPAKALDVFDKIMAIPSVENFTDFRFASAHINAALARFLVAERLPQTESKNAAEYYQQAHKLLSDILTNRGIAAKFVGERREQLSEIKYYAALSLHKFWLINSDPKLPFFVRKAWNNFLQESQFADNTKTNFYARNRDNALTYLQYVGTNAKRGEKAL